MCRPFHTSELVFTLTQHLGYSEQKGEKDFVTFFVGLPTGLEKLIIVFLLAQTLQVGLAAKEFNKHIIIFSIKRI